MLLQMVNFFFKSKKCVGGAIYVPPQKGVLGFNVTISNNQMNGRNYMNNLANSASGGASAGIYVDDNADNVTVSENYIGPLNNIGFRSNSPTNLIFKDNVLTRGFYLMGNGNNANIQIKNNVITKPHPSLDPWVGIGASVANAVLYQPSQTYGSVAWAQSFVNNTFNLTSCTREMAANYLLRSPHSPTKEGPVIGNIINRDTSASQIMMNNNKYYCLP